MAGIVKKTSPRKSESASQLIDARIKELHDWRGMTLSRLRALIKQADPEVVEEWKWRGAPVWSHEGIIAVGNAFKDKVKLTFYHGADLPDPNKLFNAGLEGGQWRTIDFREGDKIDEEAFKTLVRAAVKLNSSATRARRNS